MSTKLAEENIPSVAELVELFDAAQKASGTGTPIAATEATRERLIAWETFIREKVIAKTKLPTSAPHRWRLPGERQSFTHCFELVDEKEIAKGYLTMGLYPDGRLGELFLNMSKPGSFISGIMNALTYTVSIALQHGVPLHVFTSRFRHSQFSPAGMVRGAPDDLRGFKKSILDYLGEYLDFRFPDGALRALDVPEVEKEPAAGELKAVSDDGDDPISL